MTQHLLPLAHVQPPELTAAEVRGRAVDLALARLPEPQRAVLTGCFLEGRTVVDLARRSGLPEPEVVRLRDAGLAGLGAALAGAVAPRSGTAVPETARRAYARD